MSSGIPTIPTTVWIEHVLPFLDRLSWNRLCATNKDLHQKSAGLKCPPWPQHKNLSVESRVSNLAFSSHGEFLALGDADRGKVQLLSVVDGKLTPIYDEPQLLGITGLTISPNNKWLASGRWNDNTITLLNIRDGTQRVLEGHTRAVLGLLFSPVDASILASGSFDGCLRVWKDENPIRTFHHEGMRLIYSMDFSPDGTLLAAVGDSGDICFWRLADSENATMDDDIHHSETQPQHTIKHNHTSRCTGVKFSSDGSLLATGSWDPAVKIWDLETNNCKGTLQPSDEVNSILFSPNGKVVAAACCDQSLHFWTMESFAPIVVLRNYHATTWCRVTVSATGTLASSGPHSDSIRLWNPAIDHADQDDDELKELRFLWG